MKSLFFLSLLSACAMIALAGNLDPTDPPAPTMKTLDEVEPRIPIPASDTTADTFIIIDSGSYYLAGNRLCLQDGIRVDANDVTIDLMGYSLIGRDIQTYKGISIYGRRNVRIQNGTIRGFGRGIYENYNTGQNHHVVNIRAVSNLISGIDLLGHKHIVKDCMVSGNGEVTTGARGIFTGKGSRVIGNTVCNNGKSVTVSVNGISVGHGSTVTSNAVYDNGNSAQGSVYGINCSSGCVAMDNAVYNNGNSAQGNVYGIYADVGSTIKNNTTYSNGDYATGAEVNGIYAKSGCTITGDTAFENGNHSPSNLIQGIYAGGSCAVIGNSSCSNGYFAPSTGTIYGIYLGGSCLVDQNAATFNGVNSPGTKINMNTPGSGTITASNYAP